MTPHLSWRDTLLALAVVLVWGTNFVVIKLGLNALPPLFFATLRFVFVFAPAAFFLPRPSRVGESQSDKKYVSWSNLAIYGLCIGLIQFGLLFIAMNGPHFARTGLAGCPNAGLLHHRAFDVALRRTHQTTPDGGLCASDSGHGRDRGP